MAKDQVTTTPDPEVSEFPVTFDEFLSEITSAQVESKAAFRVTMIIEGYSGNKLRSEWSALYELLSTKPTGTDWKVWAGSKGGK